MTYLLLDSIFSLWIKHDDAYLVLQLGMQKRLHPALHYISAAQFLSDITWLYGALKQSIVGRGCFVIHEYKKHQNGLLTWKCLLDTYCYDYIQ